MPRSGRRDWIYSRDVAAAVLALLDRQEPEPALVNIGSGTVWSVEDWCARLARVYPGFEYRLANNPNDANVDFFGDRDRAPMANDRLVRDVGYAPRFGLDEAFADFMAWIDATGDFWP